MDGIKEILIMPEDFADYEVFNLLRIWQLPFIYWPPHGDCTNEHAGLFKVAAPENVSLSFYAELDYVDCVQHYEWVGDE